MKGTIYIQTPVVGKPKPIEFTTLDAAFDYIKTNGNTPADTWNIIIADGYTANLTKKHRDLNCNLHIESPNGATIYIKSNSASLDPDKEPLVDPNTGDSFIGVTGSGFEQMVDVSFINIVFSIQSNFKFYKYNKKLKNEEGKYTGETVVAVAAMYYIKLYYVKSAVFYNCKMTLQNMNLSNLDFRNCSNIIIDNCTLNNYNGEIYNGEFSNNQDVYNKAGCILQFRGDIENVRVANSTFYKYGNDEILGVFADPSQAKSVKDSETPNARAVKLPAYLTDHSIKKNIIITNNKFYYQAPPFTANSAPNNNYANRVACDVLISFLGDGQGSFFDNIYFAYNTIEIKDLVRCVFKMENVDSVRQTNDFRIFGNKFNHWAYEYKKFASEDNSTGNFVRDLWVNCNSASGLSESAPYVEFSENTISAKENLGNSYNGHIAVEISGGSALVKNNVFDGTESKTQIGSIQSYPLVGIVGFDIVKCTSNLELIGNKFTGVGFFGKIHDKANTASSAGQKVKVLIKGNSVEGFSRIAFENPDSKPYSVLATEVTLTDNYFKSTSDVLLFSGFPVQGVLWASNNVWQTVKPSTYPYSTATVYYRNSTTQDSAVADSKKMKRVVFISNVITGERTISAIALPPALVSIQKNNSI